IRIPASGMKGLTFPGESVSRSVGSGVSDGAGVIGDSIGITDTQLMTTTGTTPTAAPFTTATISTGAAIGLEESAAATGAASVVEATGAEASGVEVSTVPAPRPGPSTETPGLLEDTRNPEARAASAREPSAGPSVAERQGAIHHEAAPASAAGMRVGVVSVAAGMEAVAATGRRAVMCGKL